MSAAAEPWLRGPIAGLHPVAAHLLYTFEQAREELPKFCVPVDVWRRAGGVAPVGFHLRHIAGSVDRLTTYLEGGVLSGGQLLALREEPVAGASFDAMMAAMDVQFRRTEEVVRGIAAERYGDARVVGRKRLPTTVGGLIVHMSEHTQRHLGQAVLVGRWVAIDSISASPAG